MRKNVWPFILAVEKWRSYLQATSFTIKTDYKSLLHLTDQQIHTKIQQKALLKLMDLDYTISYKKGNTNLAADGLSRHPGAAVLMAISTSIPTWMERLMEGYQDDEEFKQLIPELSITSNNSKGFQLLNDILKYNGRIWVGNNKLAQQHILTALHDSGIGGHSGVQATYQRIKQLFAWPKLKQTVVLCARLFYLPASKI